MTKHEQLIAFLATLGALVVVFAIALLAGAINDHIITKIEAFGLGTITGGLIGVLRIPSQRATVEDAKP